MSPSPGRGGIADSFPTSVSVGALEFFSSLLSVERLSHGCALRPTSVQPMDDRLYAIPKVGQIAVQSAIRTPKPDLRP